MLTFDTGTWGAQKTPEELRQERQERETELARIEEEENVMKAKRKAEHAVKEAQWAREAEEAQKNAEKENRMLEEAERKKKADDHANQAKARKQKTEQMTEVQKMEAALNAVKKAKQERSNAMQRAARNTVSNTSSSGGSGTLGRGDGSTTTKREPRGRVRVNPVTGALEQVASNANDGKVQEGCLRLDKKYMSGALAAGLGGGNGMYGHIGTIKKTFDSRANTGGRPKDGPSYGREAAATATGRETGRGSMSRVSATKVGGTTVHGITSKVSNPSRKKLQKNPNFNRRAVGACDLGGNPIRGDQKRKNNVKRMVQGRSSSGKSKGGGSSYLKSKGVVATLGGATSASTQRYQDKKAEVTEAGRRAGRLSERTTKSGPRRQAVKGTSGGNSSAAPRGDAAAMRAARLAALEKRGIS